MYNERNGTLVAAPVYKAGIGRVWISDTASYFRNCVPAKLKKALKVDNQFAVVYTPWSNCTCERMAMEIILTLHSILSEEPYSCLNRCTLSSWFNGL